MSFQLVEVGVHVLDRVVRLPVHVPATARGHPPLLRQPLHVFDHEAVLDPVGLQAGDEFGEVRGPRHYVHIAFQSFKMEMIMYLEAKTVNVCHSYLSKVTTESDTALGLSQGSVKSFLSGSTGQWAMLQLQCSQAREILQEELLQRNKQNLYVRPSAPLCI